MTERDQMSRGHRSFLEEQAERLADPARREEDVTAGSSNFSVQGSLPGGLGEGGDARLAPNPNSCSLLFEANTNKTSHCLLNLRIDVDEQPKFLLAGRTVLTSA